MKIKNKKIIIRRAFLTLAIVGAVLGIIFLSSYKPITKKVNCYDKHNNKILNQTCEETITFPEGAQASFGISLIFLSVYIFLLPFNLFPLEDWEI